MDVEKLMEALERTEYRTKSSYNGEHLSFNIISGDDQRAALRKTVYGWAAEQTTDVDLTKRCAELEAKCYAYEKIIANSNFAPMLRSDATVFVPDPTITPVPAESIIEDVNN